MRAERDDMTIDDDEAWNRATHRANNPSRARERDRRSTQPDPAVRDALKELGGDLEDL